MIDGPTVEFLARIIEQDSPSVYVVVVHDPQSPSDDSVIGPFDAMSAISATEELRASLTRIDLFGVQLVILPMYPPSERLAVAAMNPHQPHPSNHRLLRLDKIANHWHPQLRRAVCSCGAMASVSTPSDGKWWIEAHRLAPTIPAAYLAQIMRFGVLQQAEKDG